MHCARVEKADLLLPGRVKTGCINTPEQKSRFCFLHKPRALSSTVNSRNAVIESVLEKTSTCSLTHYKVNTYAMRMYFSELNDYLIGFMAWIR